MHTRLSEREEEIHKLLGTYPESFQDIWIKETKRNTEKARELIQSTLDCSFLRRTEETFTSKNWGYSKEILDPLIIKEELRKRW